MPVIERLELAQGVEEVALVPDEGVVQLPANCPGADATGSGGR
jgi:hypothetical protein